METSDNIPPADGTPARAPIFMIDAKTGVPCPRRGNILCTNQDPDHRHVVAPMAGGAERLLSPPPSLFVIRGEINGSTCYVQRPHSEYVATPSHVGIYGATLFVHRQDAENALGEMRHATAKRMQIVELRPEVD